ncbi:hypothetical protein JW979_13795 [bacterium]|nr:hypothetical protein [candidate division CSSED10-310 bacterium]
MQRVFHCIVSGIFMSILLFLPATIHAISLSLEEVQQDIEQNNLSWIADKTAVSELSDAEFEQLLGLTPPAGLIIELPETDRNGVSGDRSSFDWRDFGGVSPVKNQGNCGSCWAFCLVHMLESHVMIYDGTTPDLSEQQLVSCNTQGYGCNGGWLDAASYFVNPGMAEESCMPYQASDVPCQAQSCTKIAIADSWAYTGDSVNDIKTALEDGPVACAMYVYNDFSYYSGGCYSHGTASSVNHGVLIVGYDDSDCSGSGAWIVKNSWGTNWGENGFFRIKYGDSNIGYGATRVFYTPSYAPRLAISDFMFDDSTGGDGDGIIEPGETIQLRITLGNSGNASATGVGAILSCKQQITIDDSFATWPDILPGYQQASQSPHFTLTIPQDYPQNSRIDFTLDISSNEGSFEDSLTSFCGNVEVLYANGFESSSDDGWVHGEVETQDDWQRDRPYGTCEWDPDIAYEGSKIWGNDLGPEGWNGEYKPNVSNYLKSCPISAGDYDEIHLTFRRWLSVENYTKDKAEILLNDSIIWHNPESSNLIDTEWQLIDIDITDYLENVSMFDITFQLNSDATGNYGGWNIDDFIITGLNHAFQEPTATPPPTPTPTGETGISLVFLQPKEIYLPDDKFGLTLSIENRGPQIKTDCYVFIELYNSYFFYPEWHESLDCRTYHFASDSEFLIPVISFDVPQDMPPCGPFYAYAVLTKPDTYTIIGTPEVTSFAFSN